MSDQSSYDALVQRYSDATYESARLRMFSDLVSVATKQAKENERLRTEVVDVTRRLGRARLVLEQISYKPGADNATAYEMRKIAAEALGHE